MLIAKKIRILPTPEQEHKMWKTAGTSRWAHNYVVASKIEDPLLKESDLRKRVTQLKKTEEYSWLKEVGNEAIKQSIMDCFKSYKRYGRANFHKKEKTRPSFHLKHESLRRVDSFQVQCEKLGHVKLAEPFPKLPKSQRYYSKPTISYDNKYWYISVCIENGIQTLEPAINPVGIDLGVKELAVVATTSSHVKTWKSINKTHKVRKLEKKLKRQHRKLSRQARMKPFDKPKELAKNYQKTRKEVQLIYRKLTNIRENYNHQVTSWVVKTKPSAIVLEDLRIRNMMRNRHLAKAIQDQNLYKFRTMIEYKAKLRSIPVIIANTFYPSSKTCHKCGTIKTHLSLSERVFRCEDCGYKADRDLNAAMNLASLANAYNI